MVIMMMHTLGLTSLHQEFKNAYLFYHGSKFYHKRASDSLAFIQGTGLDMMLETYGLMYDADHLRNVFFSMVGDHEKIKD
jgi:hypothetical protein